jgi:hypothetical protein
MTDPIWSILTRNVGATGTGIDIAPEFLADFFATAAL